nr:ribonuclease H-like domain-containing protein [Tanacetum cinerariifolium]
GVLSFENKGFESVFDNRFSDVEDSPMNDRVDESKFTYGPKHSTTSESDVKTSDLDSCESSSGVETLETVLKPVDFKPKLVSEPKVWSDAPIIKEYELDSDDEYVFKALIEQQKPSCAFINTAKHVKTPRQTVKDQDTCSQILGLTKETGLVYRLKEWVWDMITLQRHALFPVDAARQKISSQLASTSTVRQVNSARPIVNENRPRHNMYKSHLPVRRSFYRTTAPKENFAKLKVNTAEDKSVSVVRGKWETAVKASTVLLRVPRQNNMYSFNLENIVPFGGLAYLIAKATIDESNKWPRRFSWVFFLRTKDETSGILKDFIRIENQLNQKVKTIRCDNGTKFKNIDIIEFCGSKGIKREYNNARTPQQNGVAERKNRTLIKAAKTMLADSFLPNTFWAEAVSAACYVLNRVLVTNPQNKTPYELLTGKIPIISYIRPFGCHVTILNTVDNLGKFKEKSDEGLLFGYSLSSKAFRVCNFETKRGEESLHINFLENKPNVAGKGPTWLFDLDYLTDSMNYQPITAENKANKTAGPKEANKSVGTQDSFDAGPKEANNSE